MSDGRGCGGGGDGRTRSRRSRDDMTPRDGLHLGTLGHTLHATATPNLNSSSPLCLSRSEPAALISLMSRHCSKNRQRIQLLQDLVFAGHEVWEERIGEVGGGFEEFVRAAAEWISVSV